MSYLDSVKEEEIMSKPGKRLKLGVMAAALCVTGSGWAATDANLPPMRTQGEVRYMSGGIGLEQQEAMKQAAYQYPLELEFLERAETQAFYAAGVRVTISDRTGKIVLDTRSDGPFFLAMLPAGRYTISAESSGSVKTRQVTIERDKRTMVVFAWKA